MLASSMRSSSDFRNSSADVLSVIAVMEPSSALGLSSGDFIAWITLSPLRCCSLRRGNSFRQETLFLENHPASRRGRGTR